MTAFGDIEFYDDLRVCAPPYARLTPSQALDLAECMTRTAFQRMLTEEMEREKDPESV